MRLREFFLFFSVQLIVYLLLTLNYRAVAVGNYTQTAATDFAIASVNFFIIRKIAKNEDSIPAWCGYVTGSVVGSILGIYFSKITLHG